MSDQTPSQSTFVVRHRGRGLALGAVVLETDDWVAAERCASDAAFKGTFLAIHGVHPTHTWTDPLRHRDGQRCTGCGAWNNGSYGSHGPCGYEWTLSLLGHLDREEAARVR